MSEEVRYEDKGDLIEELDLLQRLIERIKDKLLRTDKNQI